MEEEVAVALEANGEKNACLEKEIRDIKSNLCRLEAKLHSHRPQPKPQTAQLSMMKKQGEDYEELKKLNADLEDKFIEMVSTIADIKCSLSGLMLQMPAASSTTSKSSMSVSGIYAEEDEDDDQISEFVGEYFRVAYRFGIFDLYPYRFQPIALPTCRICNWHALQHACSKNSKVV
ncbi:hypothetical protein D8674_019662 [Pyrus ussuriensis x Pyrus communis]|uniref:Uncharacterized protein n=1 Tax=Pyrus ussuriensis x Pyrus communis TaxID=2448454 RepID=A0A5N5GDS8_9ROSA|nr:hypothetical protein D8674_019662 [Pyrus ussuriensis x Pyrus communis]